MRMDIEDLSKSQLLLLTILVNFVVAIATGVLTVSLLDEAPTTVTQTVNRIVDHTIETVTTQVPSAGNHAPSTEDLLTSALAESSARTVYLYRASSETLVAAGLFLPTSKVVVSVSADLPGHVIVVFADGARVEADKISEDGILKVYAFAADATLPSAPTASLIPSSEVKQGQTAIGLSADGSAVTGIVSKIDASGISANVPGVPLGAAVVNLSGGVIGIHAGNNLYFSAERIDALLPAP